jgi:hypothetical protein
VIQSRRKKWEPGILILLEKDEYRILAGKPKRRKILGKSSRRWEDNIKKDLLELG